MEHDDNPPIAYALVDNGRFDMSPAERFGQVEFILDRDFSPYPSPANDRVAQRLKEFISKFRPETDFLIPVGSPTTIFRLGMMMRHAGIGACKVLHFEARRLAYILVEVEL